MTAALTLALGIAVAFALAPLVARLPGLVALPVPDRWHRQATPTTGGIALLAALAAALVPALALEGLPAGYAALLVLAAAAFAVGLVDDVRPLPPRLKLGLQVAVATGAALGGVRPDWSPAWASVALAIVVLVAAMNCLNLLDHADGLASGIATIAALGLAAIAALGAGGGAVLVPLAVAGACLGFLPWNYRRRRPAVLFMGDSGSHLLGALLGGLALLTTVQGDGIAVAVAAPLLLLAVPLLDTALVTAVRLAEGRPISQGGRDHSSHRLVYAGLDGYRAVGLLLALGALSAAAAVVVAAAGDTRAAIAATGVVFAMLAVLGVRLAAIDGATDDARPR